jgi:hypothetical protein
MAYAKGLLRPDPAKLARRLHASLHPLLAAGGTPRGAASLTPCQRLDQGQTGTCHAHSAAAAIWTALNSAGKPVAFIPSPRLIAATTYADVRAASTPVGEPLPPLQDTGADLSDDATALAKWGVAPFAESSTSDGRFSDVENDPPDNVFPEPDVAQLQIAGADLIAGEYSIPVDSGAPNLCALALDAGLPIWLGFFVDSAFEAATASTIVGAPNQSDPSGGGHAVYLSAYRTATDGTFEFLLQNSWGDGWAMSGAVWCAQAWLLETWMLWPMAVKVNS